MLVPNHPTKNVHLPLAMMVGIDDLAKVRITGDLVWNTVINFVTRHRVLCKRWRMLRTATQMTLKHDTNRWAARYIKATSECYREIKDIEDYLLWIHSRCRLLNIVVEDLNREED